MQRRQLIQRGLIGGALLAFAGLALWPPPPQHHGVLRVLNERAFLTLLAVAACTTAGSGADANVIAHSVDKSLAFAPAHVRTDIERALLLLDNRLVSSFTRFSARAFSDLTLEQQTAALLSWRDSHVVVLRAAYHALRKLCLAAFYASDAAFARVGYPGPNINKATPKAIAAREPLHTGST